MLLEAVAIWWIRPGSNEAGECDRLMCVKRAPRWLPWFPQARSRVLCRLRPALRGIVGHSWRSVSALSRQPCCSSRPPRPLPHPAAVAHPGYSFVVPRLVGEAPGGFRVYVSPSGSDARSVAARTQAAVALLRSYGLPVTYAGYGNPHNRKGIIAIGESARGCHGSGATLANTHWWYRRLPGGGYYMYRSEIPICPPQYARAGDAERNAIIRHEMGHAMGLGHTNYLYASSYQSMNAYAQEGVSSYQTGEATGLQRLAVGTDIVRRLLG